MVYMTADGLMSKVTKHCQKYGLSYSKLAQLAIAEKLEREERRQTKGVRGSQATNHREQADTPTVEAAVISKTKTFFKKGGLGA